MSYWLLATVCAGPFLFGCVEPWSSGLLQASVFLLACVLILARPFRWSAVPPLAWGCLLVAALAAVQSRHPAHAVGAATTPVTSSGWASAEAARLWVMYACLSWVTATLAQSRRRSRRVAWSLFVLGSVVAVIGIIQKGSGAETFYGIRPIPDGFIPFGPYYYKNHAGSLMIMTFAIGLGAVWARYAGYHGSRRVGAMATFWMTQAFLIALLAIQGVAIWMCQSRGAIHSLAIAGVAVGALASIGFASRRVRTRWFVTLLVLIAGYVALAVAFPRLADIVEEGGRTTGSFETRVRIWKASWVMIRERPVWGYGMGAFEYAFAPYQGTLLGDLTAPVDHAHSEWVEILLGGGAVAAGLIAIALLVQVVWSLRAWWAWTEPAVQPLLGGAFAAFLTFPIHGSAEFNLSSPANVAVLLTAAGMVFRPAPRGAATKLEARPQHFAGWPGRAGLLALAVWGCWSTTHQLGGWWCAHQAVGSDLPARSAWYERALTWVPGHPGYERELGVALLWLGDENPVARRLLARQALMAAARGLKVTPDHAGLAEVAGVALCWTGREKEGRQFLAAAEALRPWRRARRPWVRTIRRGP